MTAMTVNNGTDVTVSVAFQVAFVLNMSAALLDVAVVCGIVSQFSRGKRHLTYRCIQSTLAISMLRYVSVCGKVGEGRNVKIAKHN